MNYESWMKQQQKEIEKIQAETRQAVTDLRRIERTYRLDMTHAIHAIWEAEGERLESIDYAFCLHNQRARRTETPDALNVLHDVWKDIINTPRNMQSDVLVFIYDGESWAFESKYTAAISLHMSKAMKLGGKVFYLNPRHGVFRTILGRLR